ncbi:hypothetical protein NRK67_12080 [Fusobacteria bacterium ZRK30]|nr:hypothetical protein NRK67_12080 [Fusobacteria bacterium ZRK30]
METVIILVFGVLIGSFLPFNNQNKEHIEGKVPGNKKQIIMIDELVKPEEILDENDEPVKPEEILDGNDEPVKPEEILDENDEPVKPEEILDGNDEPVKPEEILDENDEPVKPEEILDENDEPVKPEEILDENNEPAKLEEILEQNETLIENKGGENVPAVENSAINKAQELLTTKVITVGTTIALVIIFLLIVIGLLNYRKEEKKVL